MHNSKNSCIFASEIIKIAIKKRGQRLKFCKETMNTSEYYSKVQCDLDEGYSVKLISKSGFKMKVSFSHLDETGEPYYVVVGIDGSQLARNSEIFDTKGLENFICSDFDPMDLYE